MSLSFQPLSVHSECHSSEALFALACKHITICAGESTASKLQVCIWILEVIRLSVEIRNTNDFLHDTENLLKFSKPTEIRD